MPSVVGLFMQTIVIDALACFTVTPYLVSEEGNMVSNGHAADRQLRTERVTEAWRRKR